MSRINYPKPNNVLRHTLSALAIVGVLLALYPVAQNVYTFWNQRTLQNQLATAQTAAAQTKSAQTKSAQKRLVKTSSTRSSAAQNKKTKSVAVVKTAARAWPLTRMTCDEIGLDAIVVSGQDESSLKRGPGHDPQTAFPGERGNCVIAAHRNVYGSYFMRVDELLPGSIVTLQTPDASYRYSVIQIYTVADTDTQIRRPPTDPNSPPLLTLFTCTLPRTATRVVVTAQLLDNDAP